MTCVADLLVSDELPGVEARLVVLHLVWFVEALVAHLTAVLVVARMFVHVVGQTLGSSCNQMC